MKVKVKLRDGSEYEGIFKGSDIEESLDKVGEIVIVSGVKGLIFKKEEIGEIFDGIKMISFRGNYYR